MLTIENARFVAAINPLGAELVHLYDKTAHREVIWDDTTGAFWGRHAPLLFPSIGKSNDDAYVLDEKRYEMRQHGFARDNEFSVSEQKDTAVTLELHANSDTRALYPFDFTLKVFYELTDAGLSVAYSVTNDSDKTMPYSLGFHPGFALTQALENYTLTLRGAETPLQRFGINPVPFRDGRVVPFEEAEGNHVPLSHSLLDGGLIILDATHASEAVLEAHDGSERVLITLQDFPYLTLWSPEGKEAPFVCVEPFAGLPDVAGEPSDWMTKSGNTLLKPGETNKYALQITLD